MLTPASRAARISRVRRSCAGLVKLCRKPIATLSAPSAASLSASCIDRLLVERRDDPAARVDALRHDKAQAARHQGRRQVDIDVVLLEAVLVPDLDRVAEPLGRNQRGPGALALDDRVGRQRRAVDNDRQIGRHQPGFAQHRAHRVDDGAFRSLGSGQDLRAEPAPVRFQRDIGKGAADIDPEPCRLMVHVPPALPRSVTRRKFDANTPMSMQPAGSVGRGRAPGGGATRRLPRTGTAPGSGCRN